MKKIVFLFIICFLFNAGCVTQVPSLEKLFNQDKFKWLENRHGKQAIKWVKKQNLITTTSIINSKEYRKNFKSIKEILSKKENVPSFKVHGQYIYNVYKKAFNSRGQWRRIKIESVKKPIDKWEVVLDLDELGRKERKKYSFYDARCLKPEGRYCLIALSETGGDFVEIREFDTNRKKFVKNGFRIPKAKTVFSWVDKDTIAISKEFSKGSVTQSGFGMELRLLKRNSNNFSKALLEVPKNYFTVIPFSKNYKKKSLTIIDRYHSVRKFDSWLVSGGKAYRIRIPEASPVHGFIGNYLIFSLKRSWQIRNVNYREGSVLAVNVNDIFFKNTPEKYSIKEVYTPSKDEFLNGSIHVTRNFIVISYISGVRGRIKTIRYKNGSFSENHVLKNKKDHLKVMNSHYLDDTLFYRSESFLSPKSIYKVSLLSEREEKVYSEKKAFLSEGMLVKQHWAESRDGTLVPFFVIGKKRVLEKGNAPALLKGYGGYGYSLLPQYDGVYGKLWLEKGGVYIVANVRGGGEFGPSWHEGGVKRNKYQSIQDFVAITKKVQELNISSSEKLGIYGGSLGGLLVGGAMALQPNLYKAVVAVVPDFDMIRGHQIGGGSWMGEIGDPRDEKDRAAILKYSPYHNLKNGIVYPSIMAFATTTDERVHPAHARKFIAKLRKYGNLNSFYYEMYSGGHKASNTINERALWKSLMITFLEKELEL